MYANPVSRVCEQCQPPCATCSKPNNLSCTSCPQYNYLLNGTCVTNCPNDHYAGYLGEFPWFQVPACLPKLILTFRLKMKVEPRTVYIEFNYGIANLLIAIIQRIQIQIADTQIDSYFYALTPIAESTIKFEYLGDNYYPPLSVLNVTIDLDTDFNTDPYQQFMTVDKSATLQLKEIYPFTKVEIRTISSSAAASNIGGSFTATGQAVGSIASGGVSLSLARMQIIGEMVQLLRFVDIRWPANVQALFSQSSIDPSSMSLPIDFTVSWNENLEDMNVSMPRIFSAEEISPFFTANYGSELSNMLVYSVIVIGGSILINFSKERIRKVTNKLQMPKTNARRTAKVHCKLLLHKLTRLLNRVDTSLFWNIEIMFLLTIYQSGIIWALINIRYYSAIIDPATSYTRGALALAIICLVLFSFLTLFIFKVVFSNLENVVKMKENLWPSHIKKYRILFDDFQNKRTLQMLFVPLSLIRSLALAFTVALLTFCPEAQIILLWCTQLSFILYMIISSPLKEKWPRIITLWMEIMLFGCITLGTIVMIMNKMTNVDPITLNEMGLSFISFCLISTALGGILTLLQVIALIIEVVKYIKRSRQKSREVYPINLAELHSKSEVMKADSNDEEKTPDASPLRTLKQGMDATLEPVKNVNYISTFARKIEGLSPEQVYETPEGAGLLKSIDKWWKSNSENESMTLEPSDIKRSRKRDLLAKDRLELFSSESN